MIAPPLSAGRDATGPGAGYRSGPVETYQPAGSTGSGQTAGPGL
ncbi:unnamed protein product, partial [Didymodactylos carnosus]